MPIFKAAITKAGIPNANRDAYSEECLRKAAGKVPDEFEFSSCSPVTKTGFLPGTKIKHAEGAVISLIPGTRE